MNAFCLNDQLQTWLTDDDDDETNYLLSVRDHSRNQFPYPVERGDPVAHMAPLRLVQAPAGFDEESGEVDHDDHAAAAAAAELSCRAQVLF